MRFEDYESLERWRVKPNGERRFSESSEPTYLSDMERFCRILGMNPDSIVEQVKRSSDPKIEIFKIKLKIATSLKQENALKKQEDILKERSIHKQYNELNTFLRANGIKVTRADIKEFPEWASKHGASWMVRETRWKPD